MFPPRNFPPRRQNRRENVNESIRAREVRAVFPDGTTEVMPTAAALRKAQEMGLDLVLIAPTQVPPVARAVSHGTVEGVPRLEGRNAHILISPVKVTGKSNPGEKPPRPQPASAPAPQQQPS